MTNSRMHYFVHLTAFVSLLVTVERIYAAEYSCTSGDVTCLIAAINEANGIPGEHTISLEPGKYTLQAADNNIDGSNGLPSIRARVRIQASDEDFPTIIERDLASAGAFRIFHVSEGGELSLQGVTIERVRLGSGAAIFNRGITSLRDSIVQNIIGLDGVIHNFGTLNVFRSIIADNGASGSGGGIYNRTGGSVVVENSSIDHNAANAGGGVFNEGSLIVRNSAVIF